MKGPPQFVWAAIRGDLALITGRRCDELVLQVAPKARWSTSGKGFVITIDQLADLCCLCTEERIPYRERQAS